MKFLKYLKAMLVLAILTLPANLIAFWAPGDGNTDYCPNGSWVGGCPWEWVPPGTGIDWSQVLLWLNFF